MRDRGVHGVPAVDEPSPTSSGHRAAVQRAAQNAIFRYFAQCSAVTLAIEVWLCQKRSTFKDVVSRLHDKSPNGLEGAHITQLTAFSPKPTH